MSNGMIKRLVIATFLLCAGVDINAEIFKTVDENGNVVFTDQQPADGSPPMDLPEISVIETNYQDTGASSTDPAQAGEGNENILTPRELRRQYRDFRILQPAQEETFWGTANTVLVNWGAAEPFSPGMNVNLFVDGEVRNVPATGSVTLRLDRGEHQVYAELRDERNRRITTTEKVTFFVKQHSVNFNRPGRGG
jgi:hypothetical protein